MPDPIVARIQCITLGGPDVRAFAQAQFASDVDRLEPMHWRWSAWLDAQGRVQALMHLADVGDGRLLAVLRGGDARSICDRLARYRLRARITLDVDTFAGHAAAAAPLGSVGIDGDGYRLGWGERSLRLTRANGTVAVSAAAAWHRADIEAGWPSLPAGSPQFLPPALSLERLGAVSLEKGCYPGQEIVARLHHRGGHKYRLCHLRGRTAVPFGTHAGSPGEGPIEALDAAFSNGSADVLAVVRTPVPLNINMLHDSYDVVSIFDA